MSVKVAINGFGRIGRLAFRQMFGLFCEIGQFVLVVFYLK